MTSFDFQRAFSRIREAVRPFPPAALFQLYDEGFTTPFQQLLACMISIRTRDEVTVPAARALFVLAPTPETLAALDERALDRTIAASSFHEAKSRQMKTIARRTLSEFGGQVPCDEGVMLSFPGIGPKCAHLVLGIACGIPLIGVDIHVHRVTNRWGIVASSTPEKTMEALNAILPTKYRVEINRLLVPFGKHLCTSLRPKCSTCVVRDMCMRVGVTSSR